MSVLQNNLVKAVAIPPIAQFLIKITTPTLNAVPLDIDGTLTFQGVPISGAHEALQSLERLTLSFRLLSNISERLPATITAELQAQFAALSINALIAERDREELKGTKLA